MQYIKNVFKGIFIGIATLVPGVSGGTMAIILGVYDDLIHSISSFFTNWKKSILFLAQIGIGAILGIGLLSNLLETAIIKFPHTMQFLFIGIILGGLPVLYKKTGTSTKRHISDYFLFILGFVIVLLLGSDPEVVTTMASNEGSGNFLFLFIAGIIIAVALVLPGISASFMLLALGLYEITLNSINTLNIAFLIPIALGILVGTLASTKLIEKFLVTYPRKAYMLIIGFVIGSLIAVYPGIPSGFHIITSTLAFVIGFIIIFLIGSKSSAY
jgi:putative membrane protein